MPIMSEHYGTDYDRSHTGYGSHHPGQALAAAYHNKTAANYFSVSHLLDLEAFPRQDCAIYDSINHSDHVSPPLPHKRQSLSPQHHHLHPHHSEQQPCRRQESLMPSPSDRSMTSSCALSPRHCADSPVSDSSDKNTSGKIFRNYLIENEQLFISFAISGLGNVRPISINNQYVLFRRPFRISIDFQEESHIMPTKSLTQ